MSDVLRPQTHEQVCEAVRWAAADKTPLDVVGQGSKRRLGRPGNAAYALDLSALSGIGLYEPDELVLGAAAGTPLSEIATTLAASNQHFAFEPPDFGPLLGQEAGQGTLGGLMACNFSGPRRIRAGAARDHFLGFNAVSGRGETFKSGGRVVKNVTGYDLCKLLAGSWGTLGVMTELTMKVLPAPEETRTVFVFAPDWEHGVAALTAALHSPHDISGAAFLPARLVVASPALGPFAGEMFGGETVGGETTGGELADVRGVAALRIEGPVSSVAHRCQALSAHLSGIGSGVAEGDSATSIALWEEIRDILPFANAGDQRPVWRISVAPQDGAGITREIAAWKGADAFLDWGGGLVWCAVPETETETLPGLAASRGGHATLVRGPEEMRAAAGFHPEAPGLGALTRRIKEGFDPLRILNPGRMYAGV